MLDEKKIFGETKLEQLTKFLEYWNPEKEKEMLYQDIEKFFDACFCLFPKGKRFDLAQTSNNLFALKGYLNCLARHTHNLKMLCILKGVIDKKDYIEE